MQELLRDLDRRIRLTEEVHPPAPTIGRPRRCSWPTAAPPSTVDGHPPAIVAMPTATAADAGTPASPAPSSGAMTESSSGPATTVNPSSPFVASASAAASATAAADGSVKAFERRAHTTVVADGPPTAATEAHPSSVSTTTPLFRGIGGVSTTLVAAGRSASDSSARLGSVAPTTPTPAALGGIPPADDIVSVSPASAVGSDGSVVVLPSDGFSSREERGSGATADTVDVFYEAQEGDGDVREGGGAAEMTADEDYDML